MAHPELSYTPLTTGVFGHRRGLDESLYAGDRVEIYRPLLIDPKERRKIKVDSTRDSGKWRRVKR